uniref:BACK domain-containing protein n=1 Tax=Panagrellus redivivus TaxID=6233 RepID=A0A7E4V019_PANRE
MSESETLPLVKLSYGFKSRILHLIPLAIVNKYVTICSVINKFRPKAIDAHEQVYITDNRIIRREAEADTFLFRFLKCLDQFKFWRKTMDADFLKPVWKSVLYVNEVMHKKKKVYVDDTLILNCQIQGYEKVIPKIFGPYTRLVLHGRIRWSQAKRLIHPGVKEIRMEAQLILPPIEYDDFVDFVVHQNRGVEYAFSFSNKQYYSVHLRTKLKNACQTREKRYIKRLFHPHMFHVVHQHWEFHHLFYSGPAILLFFMALFVIPIIFLFVSGGVASTPDVLNKHDIDRIVAAFLIILGSMCISLIFFLSAIPIDIISTDTSRHRFSFERFISNSMYSTVSLYNDVAINLKLFYLKHNSGGSEVSDPDSEDPHSILRRDPPERRLRQCENPPDFGFGGSVVNPEATSLRHIALFWHNEANISSCVQFTSLDNGLKVLRLAHMYQIMELIYEAVKYIWPYSILHSEDLETLSTDALNVVLTRSLKEASDVDVLRAVVRWMKANPTKSADFQDVLKNVPLTQITFKSLNSIPPEVLDRTNVLAERNRQLQTQKRIPSYQKPNKNVAFPKDSIHGCFMFKPKQRLPMHQIGTSEEGVLIDLRRQYLINFITMNIVPDGTKYSYWIAVSEDNLNWTRVIDRTKYPCCYFQSLDFESQYVRYIRIVGTAPGRDMVITEFQALYYTTMSFESDPDTTLFIPPRFTVTFENHTVSVNGYSKPENGFVNGTNFEYDRSNLRSSGECVYKLSETCLIDCLELMSSGWDCEDRVHSYDIEVSVDETNWTRVLCVDKVSCSRGIHFDKRAVKFIKISAYPKANPVDGEGAETKSVPSGRPDRTWVRLRRNQEFPIN